MKKIFLMLFVLLLSVNCAFSFDLKDENGENREYFSSSNFNVFILTNENLTSFNLTYNVTSEVTKEFNLTYCDDTNMTFCSNFSLINLVNEQTSTIPALTEFNILVGSESKVVYLDNKNPVIDFFNYTIDTSTKKLIFNFNFSDNSNQIQKAELLEKVNLNYVLLKDVLNLNTFNLDISSSGSKVFMLKVIDLAGNENITEQIIILPDLFIPQISSYNITRNNDKIILGFKIKDDISLSKYEIIQGGLVLSESVNGNSVEKSINLPFTSGIALFKVFDSNLNYINMTLDLDSKITYKQNSIFTNKKALEFESNADECYLTKFNNKILNVKFDKSSNKFSVPILINEVKDYPAEFSCTLNNYNEYFITSVYYDVNSPSEPIINISNDNKEGFLELKWSGGIDNESEVLFNLYKDSKIIYSGKKSYYSDKEVEYPNEYSYYVEAVDEAGNKVKSEKIFETPKKVKVNLNINLKKEQILNDSHFTLSLNTDLNSNISIFVKNNKTIVFEKIFENNSENLIVQEIMFEEGVNEISIVIIDEFSNTLKQVYYVTYQVPILSNNIINEEIISQKNSSIYKISVAENITDILVPDKVQEFAQNTILGISSIFGQEEKVEEESVLSYSKIFLFLLFIIFAVLIWHYLFYEDKLRQKFKDLKYLKENKNMVFFRNKEKILNSNIKKIKTERENREFQKQILVEKNKKEITREMSEYEKQKLSELSKKDRISDRIISQDKRNPSVEKVKKKEPVFIDEEELMELNTKRKEESKKSSFFSWFNKEVEEEKIKHDPMLSYIDKVHHSTSYNSKKDYRFREDEENKKVEEKIVEIKKDEIKPEIKVDKKHMLDDYLTKRISKRKYFFAERDVQKDLNNRKE